MEWVYLHHLKHYTLVPSFAANIVVFLLLPFQIPDTYVSTFVQSKRLLASKLNIFNFILCFSGLHFLFMAVPFASYGSGDATTTKGTFVICFVNVESPCSNVWAFVINTKLLITLKDY